MIIILLWYFVDWSHTMPLIMSVSCIMTPICQIVLCIYPSSLGWIHWSVCVGVWWICLAFASLPWACFACIESCQCTPDIHPSIFCIPLCRNPVSWCFTEIICWYSYRARGPQWFLESLWRDLMQLHSHLTFSVSFQCIWTYSGWS